MLQLLTSVLSLFSGDCIQRHTVDPHVVILALVSQFNGLGPRRPAVMGCNAFATAHNSIDTEVAIVYFPIQVNEWKTNSERLPILTCKLVGNSDN